jgi:transposase
VTFRYCSPEEEREIIGMYKSGEYSYQQIADMKNLSKGTIINIVKGYPYCQDKVTYYARLAEQAEFKLEQEITATKERAHKAHSRGNMSDYGMHTRQWLILIDLLPDKEHIYDRLKNERMLCEQKAWEGLSGSNYREFGFHADTWNLLTEIIGDNAKNPWASIVGGAKGKSKSVRFDKVNSKGRKINFTAIVSNSENFKLSDNSWEFIRPLVVENETGRPSDHRRLMEGILYALIHCGSFRSVPKQYGDRYPITTHFAEWYKADVFRDLLSLTSVCPELEQVKLALLQIEKHRLMYGDSVPRLCDIRKGVEYEKEKEDTDRT